ncbi:MAG TPA: hypothetical protein VFM25_02910, partial [Verrucomicrobiae bacterium]|nr:hypothetical protein [Verrucomicrobiae bacterium]
MFEKFNFRARLATNTILRGALRTCPKIFKSVTKLDNAALLRGKTISQSAAILSIGADFGELANSPRTIPVTEKIWRNN